MHSFIIVDKYMYMLKWLSLRFYISLNTRIIYLWKNVTEAYSQENARPSGYSF